MRKIFLALALLAVFSGCDLLERESEPTVEPDSDEIAELREKIEELEEKLEEKEEPAEEEDPAEEEEEAEEKKAEPYTGANYVTVDSPDNEFTTHEEPIVFKGSVSPNANKIVVTSSGGDPWCGAYADGPCFAYYEDVYTLTGFKYGDDTFTYRAKFEYDNLTYGTNEYEFKAYFDDGTTKTANRTIYYVMGGAEMGKPVIYLYPEETMAVSVNVEPTDGISVSEPEIGDGWDVVASPDGKIFNLGDLAVYPYLFWEGFAADFETPEEGFVVEGDGVSDFFDEKLAVLGLNATEIADFKEFWVPRLSGDPYYFITFVPQDEFDGYAPLTVSPEPDSVIRVFFDYRGLDEAVAVEEQVFETPTREGFTVVEWGGRLYR